MERDRGTEGETPTPSRAIDAFIGNEEHNGEQKKEKKRKKQGPGPNPATLDHSVASYDPHLSYGTPIPNPTPPS